MNFRNFTALTTVLTLGLGASNLAFAQVADTNTNNDTMSAAAVENMEDQSPIVLTGTVGEIRSDEFDLRYQGNKITVELDRFGWQSEEATKILRPGELITVSGYIDDDLFEGREIEAYNVRLNDRDLYYYTTTMIPVYDYTYDHQAFNNDARNTNAAANTRSSNNTMEDGAYVTMTGTVSGISGDEFTLTSNKRSMTVDVSELGYEPFAEDRYQRIADGDRVYVYGQVTDEFFDSKEIVASSMTKLMDNTRSN